MSIFQQRQAAKKAADTKSKLMPTPPKVERKSRFGERVAARRALKDGNSQQSSSTVQQTATQGLEHFQTVIAAYVEKMRDIEDINDRIPLKAEAVSEVEPFVSDYVAKEANYPNSVAVRYTIWLFDLGDIATAVPLALHLIEQGIHVTPAEFNSDLPTFVCDQVYDWANSQLKANKSAGPYLHNVVETMLKAGWDMHEAVRGKMVAMLGKHYEQAGQEEEAIKTYEMALIKNEGAGVKTRLDKLKKLHSAE